MRRCPLHCVKTMCFRHNDSLDVSAIFSTNEELYRAWCCGRASQIMCMCTVCISTQSRKTRGPRSELDVPNSLMTLSVARGRSVFACTPRCGVIGKKNSWPEFSFISSLHHVEVDDAEESFQCHNLWKCVHQPKSRCSLVVDRGRD